MTQLDDLPDHISASYEDDIDFADYFKSPELPKELFPDIDYSGTEASEWGKHNEVADQGQKKPTRSSLPTSPQPSPAGQKKVAPLTLPPRPATVSSGEYLKTSSRTTTATLSQTQTKSLPPPSGTASVPDPGPAALPPLATGALIGFDDESLPGLGLLNVDLAYPLPPTATNRYSTTFKPGLNTPGLQPKVDRFGQKLTNKRTGGLRQNPKDFYHDTPVPAGWGPIDWRGKHIFRYTNAGELDGNVKFTPELLHDYFTGSKARGVNLRLWIQHPPSQSNWRYPRSTDSSKCRFDECPMHNNTILKGMLRVAIDENPDQTGRLYDPFHCAGYLHLYCLEKALDLFAVTEAGIVDVQPDTRTLHCEDVNPMALHRDGLALVYEFNAWVHDQRDLFRRHRGVRPPVVRDRDLLSKRMTRAHIKQQSVARALARDDRKAQRERQGGTNTDISKWQGDLDEYVRIKDRELARKRAAQQLVVKCVRSDASSGGGGGSGSGGGSGAGRPRKRAARHVEDETCSEEEVEQQHVKKKQKNEDARSSITFTPINYQQAKSSTTTTTTAPVPASMQFSDTGHAPDFRGPVTRRRSKILAAAAGEEARLQVIAEEAYPPLRRTGSASRDVVAPEPSPGPHRPALPAELSRPKRKRVAEDFEAGGENHLIAKWEADRYNYKRTARRRVRLSSLPF